MKTLVILAVFVALSAGGAIPVDTSDFVESEVQPVDLPEPEILEEPIDLAEDSLRDVEEPVNAEEEAVAFDDPSRNGANNQYWLFTRQNPTNRQVIQHNNANSVRNSNYRGNRGLVAIVHGWNNNGNSPMNPQITAAFLAVMDVNVIVVDWGQWANGAYNRAVNAVPSVGNHLGDFMSFLFSTSGGNWNQVHLVGFSLGAHVVGNAGRRVGGRPTRVTGLDPASFQWGGNANALNRNSGRYVEAIHTDGRAAGIFDPIANADFYPNGGRHPQPGCRNNVCSHGRATELFASSVRRHNRFVARGCINLAQAELSACSGAQAHMGNGVWNKNANGLFGLRTGNAYPF